MVNRRDLSVRKAAAVVLDVEIDVGPRRHDAKRVQVRVRRVVMEFDVLHVDSRVDGRKLVQLPRVLKPRDRRIKLCQ